jgi:hypothetical protein
MSVSNISWIVFVLSSVYLEHEINSCEFHGLYNLLFHARALKRIIGPLELIILMSYKNCYSFSRRIQYNSSYGIIITRILLYYT